MWMSSDQKLHTATTPHNPDQDTPTTIVTLPCIHHLSETTRRTLSPLGIWTCIRPHFTLHQTLVRVKDPTPPQPQSWCCIQDPLWNVPQGLHGSDWQDAGALTLGAQEGLNIRQCVPVNGCRACNGWVPYNQVWRSRGGEPSSILPEEMCFRSMVYPNRAAQNEPR